MKHQSRRGQDWRIFVSCLLLAVAAVLTACQPAPSRPASTSADTRAAAATAIPEVLIAVDDSEFTIPADFPGGIVRVTVQNKGSKPLDVSFTRIREGSSVDEIMQLNDDPAANIIPLMQKVSLMAGFDAISAGESQWAIIDFKTGEFLVDATEHFEGQPVAGAPHIYSHFRADQLVGVVEPQTDVKVEMNDFAFIMPDEIKAGKQLWQYHNVGKQWHMQFLVQPNPGVSMDEVATALMAHGAPAGPPPFAVVANVGTSPLSEGERMWMESDLPAGEYLAGCPIPDVAAIMAGEAPLSHLAHGMHRLLTVK